jgi:hypothetical protein
MALNPGEDFDRRYLVRRKVQLRLTNATDPVERAPRIALSEYRKGADSWFTTKHTTAGYGFQETIGYLFTDQIPNSLPVYDCYIEFWDDHMLVPGDESCGGGEVHRLGKVGWISTLPFPNSVLVYRCYDEAATNHFISKDPSCEGKTVEWPIGYLADVPPIPQPPFVALSDYFSSAIQDNWVTTTLPPESYTFTGRLGYLLTSPGEGTLPIYDCYLPNEQDHMLDIDPNCGNPAVENLGLIGWIAIEPFPDSVAVYRCHDGETYNHFVSTDPACAGKTVEWRIGFLVNEPDAFYGWQTFLPTMLWLWE